MADHDHSGHRQRLKDRFLKEGSFDSFQSHNILELLLFYTIPRKDTNELAHILLDSFGSLSAVFDAPFEDLIKVKGISENTATLIKAIVPLTRAYSADKYSGKVILDTTEKISNYLLEQYIGYRDEVLTLISMDNCCRVLAFDVVVKGSINSVGADTRKIIEILLRTGATSAIIAHNHPGGFALPSVGDIKATRAVIFACNNIGVTLQDHLIVAADECVSLKNSKDYRDLFSR